MSCKDHLRIAEGLLMIGKDSLRIVKGSHSDLLRTALDCMLTVQGLFKDWQGLFKDCLRTA